MQYSETYALETEAEYPYTGVGALCDYQKSEGEVTTKSYGRAFPNDPTSL